MSEELFDVVFFGILQAGKDKDTVMQNMASLFKTDASKLAPYFAGGRKVIKGNINAAAAEKYRAALENIGLSIKLEPCVSGSSEQGDQQNNETTAKATSETSIDTSGLAMAAAGSDIIETPVVVPAKKIDDISDISMAETGADVIENPVAVPAQKIEDISDISMAEVGSDVLTTPKAVEPQKIEDISDLTLAEAGADIIENPAPEKQTELPDTSELSLND